MRDWKTLIFAVAIASASGSACGMTELASKRDQCRVVGGEKLPSEVGGSTVICAAIEAAVKAKAPDIPFFVEVRVLSDTLLAATVRLENGRTLPEQKLGVSDRKLNQGSIDRFAAAIASQIAGAGVSKHD